MTGRYVVNSVTLYLFSGIMRKLLHAGMHRETVRKKRLKNRLNDKTSKPANLIIDMTVWFL